MKKTAFIFVVLALSATSVFGQVPDSSTTDPNPSIQVLVDRGLQAEYNRDFHAAFSFYSQAADRGSKAGLRRLGLLYETGSGVEKDPARARTYYLQADDKWAHECLCTLNMTALNGSQALYWCTKAANAGLPLAKLNLGALYRDGMGPVLPDRNRALEWLRQITDDAIFGEDAELMIEKLTNVSGK